VTALVIASWMRSGITAELSQNFIGLPLAP
jgi:hypothetical protein